MLLLYRNRVGWFQHKTTPTFGGPPGESVSWETRVFFGVEVGKGVYLQHEVPCHFLVIFHGNPWLWELGYQFMRNKLFFFGSGHFFGGGFLSRSRWLDHVMSSTSKKGPKFWSDAELASKKAVRKWWGLIFLAPFYNIYIYKYFWGGFGASSILFQRFFDETMRQISTNSHIICIYIVSTAYRLVHSLKTADQVHPRKLTVDTQNICIYINIIFEAGDTF